MSTPERLVLSPLPHTWILDLDGTLVVHNGYKSGEDYWLPGALEFLRAIPETDLVIILTAREEAARERTERFLAESRVLYHRILFDVPQGERILLNDAKPSGLTCAIAVDVDRDVGLRRLRLEIDPKL